MVKSLRLSVVGIILLILPFSVAMSSPVSALSALLANYRTFSAHFTERTSMDKGEVIAESKGRFWLRRPNQFRWEANGPSQQIIIGDGRTLWIYDVDLMQATKQPQQQNNTPIQLLLGDPAKLSRHYIIAEQKLGQGKVRFEFVAKQQDAVFQQVVLQFFHGKLQQLSLHNNLGQHSQFVFTKPVLNQALNADLFQFTPGADVDVISHDAG